MITTLTKPTITPAELLEMPNAKSYELVDGQLVERHASTLSSLVEGIAFASVFGYCKANKLGEVWPGTMGYQCFQEHPGKVRRPDVTFIRADRFSQDMLQLGYLHIAPDLAVEVISPGDLAHEVAEKIEEYLAADVQLLWVVEPELRIVDVYRKNGSIARLRESDELQGENVLPGFRCRVADLFPPVASA
jgi:Uma2 family endonuclease